MEVKFDDFFGSKVISGFSEAASDAIYKAAAQIARSNEKPVLNQRQAAEYLAVSPTIFRQVLMPRGIPSIVLPGVSHPRYYKEEILKWYVNNFQVKDGYVPSKVEGK